MRDSNSVEHCEQDKDVHARARGREEHARGVAGLSKPHISPPQFEAEIWLGGSMMTCKQVGEREQVGGGKRGKITEFTKAARLRMMRKMAQTDRASVPLFLTLTYPDQFPTDPKRWSRDMDAFGKRLQRKGWGAIWRKEFKCRKSGENAGEYAPHYHLLVWGSTYADLFIFAHQAWYEIVGSEDERHKRAGVRVEQLRNERGTRGYVSKYCAKMDGNLADIFPDGCGRLWGVLNEDAIPWACAVTMTLDHTEAYKLLRLMRRYMRARASGRPTVNLFCNAPEFWFDRYEDLVT